MGMFQPQNYGGDIVNAMTATAGMLNDRRRLDLEEKRQTEDSKTRELQQQNLQLDNDAKRATAQREQRLTKFLDLYGRMEGGSLQPDDYKELAGVTEDIMTAAPYLPSDPKDIPLYKNAVNTVLTGADVLRKLPSGNHVYSRADGDPDINAGLDAFRVLLSKDRLGKTFTDQDGTITGKPGTVYRTADVGGFAVASGDGDKAAFNPLFSIIGEDGQPIVDATGRPVLVPATAGQTNGADDAMKFLTPDEMRMKAGFAWQVLTAAEKLGLADEGTRKKWASRNIAAGMGPDGAKELLGKLTERPQLKSIDPTHDLYDDTGKLIRKGTPNNEKESVKTEEAGVGGGMMQRFQYNPETKRYDIAVGKPYPKHAPKDGSGGSKEEKLLLNELQKERSQLIATIRSKGSDVIKARSAYAKTGVKTREDFDDSLEAQIAYEDSHAARASYDEAQARLAEVEAQIAQLTGKSGKGKSTPVQKGMKSKESPKSTAASTSIQNGRIVVKF